VPAKARPRVASMPDNRVRVPIASMAEMVMSEYAQILMVLAYSTTSRTGEKPMMKPAMIAAISMPEPV
jgi:hypothetical protein